MSTESKILRQLANSSGEYVNLEDTERRDERKRLAVLCKHGHRQIAPLIAEAGDLVSFEGKHKMPTAPFPDIAAAFADAGDDRTARLLRELRHFALIIHSTDDALAAFFGLVEVARLVGADEGELRYALSDTLADALVA